MSSERIIEDVRSQAFMDEPDVDDGGRRPQFIDELEWRWQYADGDMEPPSNFSAMVGMIQNGGPTKTNRISAGICDGAYNSAAKASEIDAALARLNDDQRKILAALYATPQGDAAAMLACVPSAAKFHAEAVTKKSTSASLMVWFSGVSNEDRIWAHPARRLVYETVLSDAVKAAKGAASAYRKARQLARARAHK